VQSEIRSALYNVSTHVSQLNRSRKVIFVNRGQNYEVMDTKMEVFNTEAVTIFELRLTTGNQRSILKIIQMHHSTQQCSTRKVPLSHFFLTQKNTAYVFSGKLLIPKSFKKFYGNVNI